MRLIRSMAARGIGDALGGIGRIGEGTLDERKAATRGLQQRHGAVAILNRGGMDLQHQWPPIRVHHGVPLAAHHLLAGIITARTASLGGLDALAVDGGSTRAGLTSDALAVEHHQSVGNGLPHMTASPGREPAVDRLPGRETGRQHPPRNAAAQHVEDGIDDLAHWPLRRSPDRCWRRQQRFQHGPFGVRQVTGEAEPVAHMLRAGGCGPHGGVHPTWSRQPVGTTSYRGHPTPIPLAFRDSLSAQQPDYIAAGHRVPRHRFSAAWRQRRDQPSRPIEF